MADDVVVNIRTRGGRQGARDVSLLGSSLRQLGIRDARAATAGINQFKRSAGSLTSSTFSGIRRGATGAGLGLAGLGAYAAKSGIQFNATMEQNEVAFANFLGSTKAAKAELQYLYKTAATTPFETTNITQAARQLLAYGFSAKQANSYIGTIGDSIAGSGGSVEQIDSLVRAIGQIKGKGKLSAEEMNQIGELGVLDRGKFAKNLGITTEQLADVGNEGITSSRALVALKKTLDDSFGGASAKQARTFNGQVSTLKDNLNQTLGVLTKPAFDRLRTDIFPKLNGATSEIGKIAGRKDLDVSQKITMSSAVLRRNFGPLEQELKSAIERAHIPERLGEAAGASIPRIGEALGRAAPAAAGAFAKGFLHAGPFGQFLTIAYLAKKFGVFTLLGSMAAKAFASSFSEEEMPQVQVNSSGGGSSGTSGTTANGAAPDDNTVAGKRTRRQKLKSGAGATTNAVVESGGSVTDLAASVPYVGEATVQAYLLAGSPSFQDAKNALGISKPKSTGYGHGKGQHPATRAEINARRRERDIVINHTTNLDGKAIVKTTRRITQDAKARR